MSHGFARWGAVKPRPQHDPPDEWAAWRQAKRLALVGSNSDPALSSYALGRLLSHDVVDRDQCNAGERYHRLVASTLGRQKELGLGGGPTATIDPSAVDKVLTEKERLIIECRQALKRQGRHVHTITDEVCVYGELRRWLIPVGGSTAGADDRAWLRRGLDTLIKIL
jgi:hypothetical protein